jgi:PAS domain S-box-containing protein
MAEYFVQLGLVIFPLCALQIWMFQKAFTRLPVSGMVIGMYGGVSAILCQLMPVHIFGVAANFASVPIILAILYGKRRAGLAAIAIVTAYHLIWHRPSDLIDIAAILIYAIIPMIVCHRFDQYSRRQRLVTATTVVFLTLAVRLAFVSTLLVFTEGIAGLGSHLNVMAVAGGIQCLLLRIALYLSATIRGNGFALARTEALIALNPIGIAITDEHYRFVRVNRAYETLTGYRASELVGKEWWTTVSDTAVREDAVRANQGGMMLNLPYVFRHKDGHKVAARYTVARLMEDDRVIGYITLFVDHSEAEQAEAALAQAQRLAELGKLAVGVAHDIRSPLSAILGLLELMPRAPEADDFIRMMRDEGTRINLLLSQLMALGQPETGERITSDLTAKLQDVIRLLMPEAKGRGVTVDLRPAAEPVRVGCDPNQLKQALLNVVKNAIEASSPGGIVTVHMLPEQDHRVRIRVVDHGEGMAAEVAEHIGEPFLTTKESGTGLGLMMTKRIVDSHHGQLEITSTPGQGTVVAITLPTPADTAKSNFTEVSAIAADGA